MGRLTRAKKRLQHLFCLVGIISTVGCVMLLRASLSAQQPPLSSSTPAYQQVTRAAAPPASTSKSNPGAGGFKKSLSEHLVRISAFREPVPPAQPVQLPQLQAAHPPARPEPAATRPQPSLSVQPPNGAAADTAMAPSDGTPAKADSTAATAPVGSKGGVVKTGAENVPPAAASKVTKSDGGAVSSTVIKAAAAVSHFKVLQIKCGAKGNTEAFKATAIMGADLAGQGLVTASAVDCCSKCALRSGCNGWTWVGMPSSTAGARELVLTYY